MSVHREVPKRALEGEEKRGRVNEGRRGAGMHRNLAIYGGDRTPVGVVLQSQPTSKTTGNRCLPLMCRTTNLRAWRCVGTENEGKGTMDVGC